MMRSWSGWLSLDREVIVRLLADPNAGPNYNFTIRQVGNTYFVNNARIVVPDTITANGVIHIIDQVLNPDNRTVVDRSASDSGLPAFIAAYETTTNTTGLTDSQPSGSSLNVSAIAGGIIGGLTVVALVCGMFWLLGRKGYTFKLEKSGPAHVPIMKI